ncbi:hypothetical protein HN865_05335 [Candidatus Woesearchaeota archaeon]|jgi:hypothetical protein|nr:hypothetical protein [Candidatus Woesearchaeota archaeon]MBT7238240.1 hypothetical protein [Candidatus Woesearchaeota archaeon]
MPRISEKKIQRIKEEVLSHLYNNPARPLFTSQIAYEMIRDEEFILRLLNELHESKLIKKISSNSNGKQFLSRRKWTLRPEVYSKYKELINN